MEKLRIEEALMTFNSKVSQANKAKNKPVQDGQISLTYLGSLLWPNSTKITQMVNMSNLSQGHTKRIDPVWVKMLCEVLECSPNFLFGYSEESGFSW